MNDMPGISASTRDRVQQLAVELGYTPSRFAKGLVQGSQASLGLAIPDLTNPYFPSFASSVVEIATQRGWDVVVDDFGHGSGSGLDAVSRLSPQVDALVGYLGSSADDAQAMMGRRPVVVLDCRCQDRGSPGWCESPGGAVEGLGCSSPACSRVNVQRRKRAGRGPGIQ